MKNPWKLHLAFMSCFWLFACTLILDFSTADAANLHAIIVCDTQADNIGKSVEADLTKVRQEVLKIAHYSGLQPKLTIFEHNNVNENVVQYVEAQTVEPEDVIIFFFSGHGYRTESKRENLWPNLYFTPIKKGIDFNQITNILREKKGRLLIAIADCCNNVMEEAYAPPVLKKSILSLRTQRIDHTKKNYKKLFVDLKGTIIISSCEPGEFSWATKSGGLYTLAFFEILNKEAIINPSADWRIILDNTSLKIMQRDLGQTPQYELVTDPV